jgi:lysophospholipase L1-like esterase
MSVGDSMMCGGASLTPPPHTDRGINGIGMQFVKMLGRPGRPAFHLNEAKAGMTHADSIANATSALPCRPDLILMLSFSANDPNYQSPAVYRAAWDRSMAFARKATDQGARIIILTYPPSNGVGAARAGQTSEAARIAANNLVRVSDYPFVDTDEIIGVGSNPVSYRSGMSDDTIHPNNDASYRLAAAVAKVARAAYGICLTP